MKTQAFDASVDLLKAILWQRDNAEKLVALARAKQAWATKSITEFWSDWYRDVFNLATANRFGLSVWARILGIAIEISAEPSGNRAVWGFGTNNLNFENGSFGRWRQGSISLSDAQIRTVLTIRYLQLTHRPTIPNINKALAMLVGGRGRAFVSDPQDMTSLVFFTDFQPDEEMRMIIENYDIIPRPATVGHEWKQQFRAAFGFGQYHKNFENGSFAR